MVLFGTFVLNRRAMWRCVSSRVRAIPVREPDVGVMAQKAGERVPHVRERPTVMSLAAAGGAPESLIKEFGRLNGGPPRHAPALKMVRNKLIFHLD